MTASPRIALVTSSYAPHIGGVETHVSHLAHGLRERAYDVEVWTVDRGEGVGRREDGELSIRVLPTPLPAASLHASSRFLREAPRAWRHWSSAFRSFRPTVLNVHCFGPNGVYAHALSRRYGAPMVLTSHGETFMDDHRIFDTSTVLRSSLRWSLRHATAVTAPSQAVLADLTSRFGLRGGTVIANGVDLDIRPHAASSLAPYVFAVGRLGATKGFDLLLEAFVSADLPQAVRLVIGGDGPERVALQDRAGALGIAGRVSFVGWMDEQAIADAMAGSLAVVVPSRVEAFGIVALEAWRAGAALLMTRHGGATEFMSDGVDAVLIEPADTEGFASAITRVYKSEPLRSQLAAAGRARVAEFSWGRVVDRYESLLSSSPMPRRA